MIDLLIQFAIHYLVIGFFITVSTMYIKDLHEAWAEWGVLGFIVQLVFSTALYPVIFYYLAEEAAQDNKK